MEPRTSPTSAPPKVIVSNMLTKLVSLIAGTLLAMALVMSFGGPVAAQQTYQPPAGVADFSNPSPGPGETFTVSGTTTPGATVQITLSGAGQSTLVLGQTVAGSDGTYSLTVTIPAGRTGSNTLVVTSNGTVLASTVLNFQTGSGSDGGTTSSGSGALPATGSSIFPLAVVAGVLILSGFGLLKLREDDDDLVEVG